MDARATITQLVRTPEDDSTALAAKLLEITRASVSRDWRCARYWLYGQVAGTRGKR